MIHVVVFKGGLGNQLFEYSFYQKYLRDGKNVKFFFYGNNTHNGFELPKWFDVELKEAPRYLQWLYNRLMPLVRRHIRIPFLLDYEDCFDGKLRTLFLDGYWQDKKFLEEGLIKFTELNISKKNTDVIKLMEENNSVAIHVRRGDYLLPQFSKIYGNVCTAEYYAKAIEIVNNKIDSPKYFVFSDDIEWVKDILSLSNTIYVDWNKGENSIFDMYLMSKAKVNIIANSSFSYWGAYLNNIKQIVIYPQRWYNSGYSAPDIFPTNWLGI